MDYIIRKQYEDLKAAGRTEVTNSVLASGIKGLSFTSYVSSLNYIDEMMNILLTKRDVQERLQNEIDNRFTQDYFISSRDDRDKLPLVEAFMLECLRYLPPIPLLVPHRIERDTEIGGYKISAGVLVKINYYTINRNKEIYSQPDEFCIDRFLDPKGSGLPIDHPTRATLIPFGVGRRYCPGMYFAQQRFFEMIAHLLQNYTLELIGDPPQTDPRHTKVTFAFFKLKDIETRARLIKRSRRIQN